MRPLSLLSSSLLCLTCVAGLMSACQSDSGVEKGDAAPKQGSDTPSPNVSAAESNAIESASGKEHAATESEGSSAAPGSAEDPRVRIYNRIIVKFAEGTPEDTTKVKAAVEQHTGAKIESIHLGPIQTAVIIFAPVSPPRDKSAQADLAKSLADFPAFAYAEADRLRGPR